MIYLLWQIFRTSLFIVMVTLLSALSVLWASLVDWRAFKNKEWFSLRAAQEAVDGIGEVWTDGWGIFV